MTSFHAWDEVRYEIFGTNDLDDITAGARRMTAEAQKRRLGEMRSQIELTQREGADLMDVRLERVSGSHD